MMTDDSDRAAVPKPVWYRRPVVVLSATILLAACCSWWSLHPNAIERRLIGKWRLENVERDGTNVNRYRFDRGGLVLSRETPDEPYVEAGFCWSARPGRLYIELDLSLKEKVFQWADTLIGGQLGSGSTTSIYTFDWISDNEIHFTGAIDDGVTTEFDMVGSREQTIP